MYVKRNSKKKLFLEFILFSDYVILDILGGFIMEKYLSLEQNLCAARVFLNTFGFVLENEVDVSMDSEIQILNQKGKTVGKLYFGNFQVVINAEYEEGSLDASYPFAKALGFVDRECGNALYEQWANDISFTLQKENHITLDGHFIVNASLDLEFGITCSCYPEFVCKVPNFYTIFFHMLKDGSVLRADIGFEDGSEVIDVSPGMSLGTFMFHRIKHEKDEYSYERYAGVFNGAESGEYKDTLHVFMQEKENKNTLYYRNEFAPRVLEKGSTEAFIQKGMLMQELDSDMFQKIQGLRELFQIDGIFLLDRLISVCLNHYTDEEIQSCLGLTRKPMVYQNGTEKLVDAYFQTGTNCFIGEDGISKLLTRNL